MTDFTELVDLASERLGGAVLLANDEFFAPKEALLRPGPPEWREDAYTDRGKWMDGWETRRRRTPGHDWCVIRLGAPGEVVGVVVDTRFFRGNFPAECRIEGCEAAGIPPLDTFEGDGAGWFELVPRSALQGDTENRFESIASARVTHLRLSIFPDGGVARLRVHGHVRPEWTRFALGGGEVDLAAMANGGYVVACSDMFFGHRQNLILPGRSRFMGDGWETRRRRGPGHDWSIVRLAQPAAVHRIELDTDHFKGNAPDHCLLEGTHAPDASAEDLAHAEWLPLTGESPLQPHARHRFEALLPHSPVSHVRLSVFPDGGVARMRVFGTLG